MFFRAFDDCEVSELARAVDVARYVLERMTAAAQTTTVPMLQRLLYRCQSWMLVACGKPLFPEEIRAWADGPMVVETWPYCQGRRTLMPEDFTIADPGALTFTERAMIDRVMATDGTMWMGGMERPWAQTRTNAAISTDSMLAFHAALQADPHTDCPLPVPMLSDISDRTFISTADMAWLASFQK